MPTAIFRVVRNYFPHLASHQYRSILHSTYGFCLGLHDHNALARIVKAQGFDHKEASEFREVLKYNCYARFIFWRSVIHYLRGGDEEIGKRRFQFDEEDVNACLSLLTDDEFIRVLHKASFESIFMQDQETIDRVIAETDVTCHSVASQRLKWIERTDPSFDGYSELKEESIRIAYYYSHFPDSARLKAYIVRSIYNKAAYLQSEMSKDQRQRQRKLPELRCPDCLKEYVHRAKTLDGKEHGQSGTFFCPVCFKKKSLLVPLKWIRTDREYETMVISADVRTDDGRCVGDCLSGNETESSITHHMDYRAVTKKLSEKSSEFLRILLEGDLKFDMWCAENRKKVRGIESECLLICEYIGANPAKVKGDLGDAYGGPQVFVVRADGEQDLVMASTRREACRYVASHYRFASVKEMEDELGTIEVRRCREAASLKMQVGQVLPYE